MKAVVALSGMVALWLSGNCIEAQEPRSLDNYLVAQDVPRIALGIGVQHYDYLPPVPNALNDLTVAANALRLSGFSTVIEEPDATESRLRTAIKQLIQLVDKTERPAVVAIYFAGHGFQDGADNFIVAKDAEPASLLDHSVAVANVVSSSRRARLGSRCSSSMHAGR
ncbi:MAG: caspase family protein [Vicinamibacterales bacterium]